MEHPVGSSIYHGTPCRIKYILDGSPCRIKYINLNTLLNFRKRSELKQQSSAYLHRARSAILVLQNFKHALCLNIPREGIANYFCTKEETKLLKFMNTTRLRIFHPFIGVI